MTSNCKYMKKIFDEVVHPRYSEGSALQQQQEQKVKKLIPSRYVFVQSQQ